MNQETGQTWVEPDERRAVAQFRDWQARQENATVTMRGGPFDSLGQMVQAIDQPNAKFTITVPPKGLPTGSVDFSTPAAPLWAWLREQLIARPYWVAEMTGIPEVARLADLPKRGPSPTLESIGELYFAKARISDHEREKSRLFWKEFRQAVQVATVRELSSEIVAAYHDSVLAADMSGTYVKHRFGKVKTILNFAKKRGMDAADLRHALDCCAVLVAPNATTLNPHPISREDFHTLLNAADVEMKALLLLALNCCMYGHEVVSLEWSDIDFANQVLIADRSKTGVSRIAVLWDRTIKALEALPHKRDQIFVGAWGAPANANLARKWFDDLRIEAEVSKTVKLSDIRDGAYSAAASGEGVDLLNVRVLGGHRCGMPDHYLKRNPKIVAKACAAVEVEYFELSVKRK